MDHYVSLGLTKDSTAEEIKKAYRQLVLIHHPDKTKNEDDSVFKKISLAYSVLGDEEKRREYDLFGSMSNLPDLSDLFDDVLHSARNFKEYVFNRNGLDDIQEIDLEVSLSEVKNGGVRKLHFDIDEICATCRGIGAKNIDDVVTCIACNGSGHSFLEIAPNFMADTMCSSCQGKKCHIKFNKVCVDCNGNALMSKQKSVDVKIPKGIPDGHVHRLLGKGSYNQETTLHDDVRVVFKYVYNKKFISVHDDNDVSVTLDVRLDEVLTGFSKTLRLYDEHVRFVSKSYVDPTEIIVIPERGLPVYKANKNGNLYVSFNVSYPSKNRFVKYEGIFRQIFKKKENEDDSVLPLIMLDEYTILSKTQ